MYNASSGLSKSFYLPTRHYVGGSGLLIQRAFRMRSERPLERKIINDSGLGRFCPVIPLKLRWLLFVSRFLFTAVRCCARVVGSWLAPLEGWSSGSSIISSRQQACSRSAGIGQSQKPTLYSLEFRGTDHVLLMFGKSCGQSQSRSAAFWWRRMRGEGSRYQSRLLLILGFEFFKHRSHGSWVIAGRIHILNS